MDSHPSPIGDMHLVSRLIAAHMPEAAQRFAEVVAELEEQRDARQRFEFEARWLLQHAKKLPCHAEVVYDDDEHPFVKGIGSVSPDPRGDSCDYVLQDCPRLQSLLAGQFTGR